MQNAQPVTYQGYVPKTEAERVTAWRGELLYDAGFPLEVAKDLAPRHEIDVHRAISMAAAGCDPYLVARILL